MAKLWSAERTMNSTPRVDAITISTPSSMDWRAIYFSLPARGTRCLRGMGTAQDAGRLRPAWRTHCAWLRARFGEDHEVGIVQKKKCEPATSFPLMNADSR